MSPFFLQCLADYRDGESLLVWLLEVTCLTGESLFLSYPLTSKGAVILMSQHPDLQNLGIWEQTLRRGAQGCFFELPRSSEPSPHHLPWVPASCDPGSSSKLLVVVSISLSETHHCDSWSQHEQIRIGRYMRVENTCMVTRGRGVVA